MKYLFFALAFMLMGSFSFANNYVEEKPMFTIEQTEHTNTSITLVTSVQYFETYFYKQIKEDGRGNCWVQVRVTETNIETGEVRTWTYWADAGNADSEGDCKRKAQELVAAL